MLTGTPPYDRTRDREERKRFSRYQNIPPIRSVDPNVPVSMVPASRGKHVRFEPIGSLYEQGKVHHVGVFDQLEDEVCCFTPESYEGDESPNRADAAVWALTELLLEEEGLSSGTFGR